VGLINNWRQRLNSRHYKSGKVVTVGISKPVHVEPEKIISSKNLFNYDSTKSTYNPIEKLFDAFRTGNIKKYDLTTLAEDTRKSDKMLASKAKLMGGVQFYSTEVDEQSTNLSFVNANYNRLDQQILLGTKCSKMLGYMITQVKQRGPTGFHWMSEQALDSFRVLYHELFHSCSGEDIFYDPYFYSFPPTTATLYIDAPSDILEEGYAELAARKKVDSLAKNLKIPVPEHPKIISADLAEGLEKILGKRFSNYLYFTSGKRGWRVKQINRLLASKLKQDLTPTQEVQLTGALIRYANTSDWYLDPFIKQIGAVKFKTAVEKLRKDLTSAKSKPV
jgi:ribosomal protein L20A (L18A)